MRFNKYNQIAESVKGIGMARMYSRKHGKSGSKRPRKPSSSWVKYKPKEIEELIVKLAKAGNDPAMIGTILRDTYGIPLVKPIIKKSITDVLKSHGLQQIMPIDMMNLMKKAVNLHNHMERNKKDYTSKRGLELTESKIRRLAKYYKKRHVLPLNWKYDIERARLIVK